METIAAKASALAAQLAESPEQPLQAQVRFLRFVQWLGPCEAAQSLVVALEQRKRHPRRHDFQRRARRELDAAMLAGLQERVGFRLGPLDRSIYQELIENGAQSWPGVSCCIDCWTVFRPARKAAALRCSACERQPRPALSPPAHHLYLPTIAVADEKVTGWQVLRSASCSECGTYYEPSRSDSLTCSPRCRVARHRRQVAGDVSELGPAARELDRRRGLLDAA